MTKNLILIATGVGLFAYVVAKIGPGALLPQISAVWIGLPLILVLSFLRLLLQTKSWSLALRTEGIQSSAGELMGVRLASQGAGYISVFGAVISEPMKIRLLKSEAGSAAVATLVDTGTYWFASGLFGIAACILAGLLVSHNRYTAIVLMVLAAAFTMGLLLIARPKPLLSPLVCALKDRCPAWLRKGERIEVAIRGFAAQNPQAMRRMLALDLACQALLAMEVAAVFWVLRIPVNVGAVLALEAANRGLKMVTGWMPARVGADEGATAGMFAALGLSSASGLVLALTRRTRDLLACTIGFAWFVSKTKSNFSQRKEFAICKA